ncbi:MAG: hypothetical protein CL609_25335 [Anaerolineaceae bacterium]|nr:hypothetical protein [Anaerolineaceae bacterium]
MTNIYLTDDDIKANRLGLLSDRQRQMVQSQRLVWIAGTVGFVGVVFGLIFILLIKFKNPDFASRGELFIFIPVMLFWL